MSFGVDYAWHGDLGPFIKALKAAKVTFAARYLSHTPGKNLTPAEASALSAAGIWIVTIWETTADRALAGHAAGAQDAKDAAAQAAACGMPAGRPVYFAVDFDATGGDQAAINAYLDGAGTVLGKSAVGVYGEYSVVAHAMQGGHAAWGYQTYAWSSSNWYGPAQLQQYSNDHTIGGVGLDFDRSTKSDFGQWMVGVSPTPEVPDVNLSDAVPTQFKGADGKMHDYWAATIMGRKPDDPPSVAYALLAAAAGPFLVNNAVIPLLNGMNETIKALAANASGVDVQPILDAIKAKIDAIEISVNVTDPPAAG